MLVHLVDFYNNNEELTFLAEFSLCVRNNPWQIHRLPGLRQKNKRTFVNRNSCSCNLARRGGLFAHKAYLTCSFVNMYMFVNVVLKWPRTKFCVTLLRAEHPAP